MGYWQKIRYGKPTKKISLQADVNQNCELPVNEPAPDPIVLVQEKIVVPDQIEEFHPLILQTKRQIKKGYHRNGLVILGNQALDIYVSPAQMERALRIMDTVIKAIERQGAKVLIKQPEWKHETTALETNGVNVYFGIEEGRKIIKGKPGILGYAMQELEPNGKLALKIRSNCRGKCRCKWSDGENKPLEKKITKFLNGLWVAAAWLKRIHQEDEERHRQWEEKEKEEARRIYAIEEEKRRGQTLEQQAAAWHKSRSIRAFIRAATKKKGVYAPDSELARWVAWATAYADRLDPLISLSSQRPPV